MGILQKNGKQKKLVISSPQPPVTTKMLVFLRTCSVMILLLSAVMMHICVLFQPWKREWIGSPRKTLEFSVWAVCRHTHKGTRCYEGEYDNAAAWFLAFRWFLMASMIIQYLCVFFAIIKILVTKNADKRHFWVPAFMSLLSAVLILIAMLILVGYREFEFMEESRMQRMGWRTEARHEVIWGWPYYMSWCTFPACLVAFVVCMFAESTETKYTKYCETEGLRKKAQYMMAG